MKMIPEHLELLKEAIHRTLDARPGVIEEYKRVGLSDMRLRWDMLWATKTVGVMPRDRWTTDVLYKYLNDDHIDTALRECVRSWQAREVTVTRAPRAASDDSLSP